MVVKCSKCGKIISDDGSKRIGFCLIVCNECEDPYKDIMLHKNKVEVFQNKQKEKLVIQLEEYTYNGTDYDRPERCAYCGKLGWITGGKSLLFISEGKELPLHKHCRKLATAKIIKE